MAKKTYYKVLVGEDGLTAPVASGKWPKIGEWTAKTTPFMCHQGWHVWNTEDSALDCYNNNKDGNPVMYIVEIRGAKVEHDNKIAAEQGKLVKRFTGMLGGYKFKDGVLVPFVRKERISANIIREELYACNYSTEKWNGYTRTQCRTFSKNEIRWAALRAANKGFSDKAKVTINKDYSVTIQELGKP